MSREGKENEAMNAVLALAFLVLIFVFVIDTPWGHLMMNKAMCEYGGLRTACSWLLEHYPEELLR